MCKMQAKMCSPARDPTYTYYREFAALASNYFDYIKDPVLYYYYQLQICLNVRSRVPDPEQLDHISSGVSTSPFRNFHM